MKRRACTTFSRTILSTGNCWGQGCTQLDGVNEVAIHVYDISSAEAQRFAQFSDSIFKGMRPRTERPPVFTDAQLSRLTMPVLVLLGENDVTMDSQRIQRRVEKNVPNAEVVILMQARHYLGDQSERIMSFLNRAKDASADN